MPKGKKMQIEVAGIAEGEDRSSKKVGTEAEVQSGDGKTVEKRRAESGVAAHRREGQWNEGATFFCRGLRCDDVEAPSSSERSQIFSLEDAHRHLLPASPHLLHEARLARRARRR